ncbi:TraB/GumN family protein [Desulfoferrobacter suflitae]|uniref:TraB/GumN family protein n=1 Tax=Desulfoferrobacter suflitae TaxID=2865782 RepID=UPI0021647CC6|nr:TraB/GumN family protein [Desulfoferrobacter suflitae]MCK8601415.1 TraB/GumN family protein [Desulfoferrobacter suflitae]
MTENDNIRRLSNGDKEVILVGTAHVSRQSVELVAQVIEQERPDTVCIELCQARYQSIVSKKEWQETDLFRVIKEKKAFLLLSNLFLAYFQKKIGQKVGITPGQEILQAIASAEGINAHVQLVDRDVRVTLLRAWRSMGFRSKFKLMGHLLASFKDLDDITEQEIERMKNKNVLEELLTELGETFPEITRVLIDERDRFLAHMIRSAPGSKIVAVVGAGHAQGIRKYWNDPIDIEDLKEIPPAGKLKGFFKWGIPILILSLIVLGFFKAGSSAGSHMIMLWIVANAALAGVGAAAALAHPLTIASAMVASPITSLNPMIAAGWVSGLVEALLGKPRVIDFENLTEDLASLKGFWKNKITKILLVTVFTNIGSSLGTFVAIPLMLKMLA